MKKQTRQLRQYLKPYRSFAGFLLFIVVISNVIGLLTSLISSMLLSSFSESIFAEVYTLVSYGTLVYCYYLGYRVFFKQFDIPLITKDKPENFFTIKGLIGFILAFLTIRFFWDSWFSLMGYESAIYDAGDQIIISEIIETCLIAPIVEEIVFRFWAYQSLSSYNKTTAILLSAIAFGMIHGTSYQSIPAIFIGIILALFTNHYHSILPAVLLHMANNTYSVLLMFLPGGQLPYAVLAVSAIIFITGCLIYYRKQLSFKSLKVTLGLLKYSVSFWIAMVIFIIMIVSDWLALV